MINKLKKIVVIGAGEMGHGIAQSALMSGFHVTLYDINEESLNRGKKRIFESLIKLYEKQIISEEIYNFSRKNITMTTNFSEAVKEVKFVFEAVPEVVDIKNDIFRKLEEHTSVQTILASNTSNMSISNIAKQLKHPERVVGIHFFNPVVLMKLVEVIKGEQTSEEVMKVAMKICEKMNKIPVRLEKDSPAFIVNRINGAMRTYLGAIVDRKLETPERIDALLKANGAPMGHFELNDYIGLDTVYNSSIYRQEMLHDNHKPYKMLTELVERGHLGRKSKRGFYDWSTGRPKIDVEDRANESLMDDIKFIKLNEASKLIEQQVATAKDIDLAMILGTGDEIGPIEACKQYSVSKIANRLHEIAQEFEMDILRPTHLVKSGFHN